jgi:hypothetical protein
MRREEPYLARDVQDGVRFVRMPFQLSIASTVGRTSKVILRRLASLFTSSITGKAPVPVPLIRRRHRQGIFSATETAGPAALSQGDVITILANTPHWFKEIPTQTIAYYAVNIEN